jgi:hypothetical protein
MEEWIVYVDIPPEKYHGLLNTLSCCKAGYLTFYCLVKRAMKG